MGIEMISATPETTASGNPLAQLCAAVADDLSLLSMLHDTEPNQEFLSLLRKDDVSNLLGLKLQSEKGLKSLDFFQHSVVSLPQQLSKETMDELAADYASIYLNHGIQASPEESVWIDEDSLACQDSMFQVRNWFQKYGLEAENWRVRPDDHLVLELQFLQYLFATRSDLETMREAAQFMDEHLLRWLMQFANRVSARCETAYFAGAALVTAYYCEELRDLLATILDEPRPSQEEIDEKMKPTQGREEVPQQYVPGIGPAV